MQDYTHASHLTCSHTAMTVHIQITCLVYTFKLTHSDRIRAYYYLYNCKSFLLSMTYASVVHLAIGGGATRRKGATGVRSKHLIMYACTAKTSAEHNQKSPVVESPLQRWFGTT